MNLKNLWKYSNENIVVYITRAEDMQLNFFEVDESISEKMFFRYLWSNFLVNLIVFALWWNIVKKTLDEVKRDLINFESEKRNERKTEKSKSVFFALYRTSLIDCHKKGHIAKFFKLKNQENL